MTSPPAPGPTPKPPFVAFLSYRHADADRAWARWLVRRIEGYKVPRHLGLGRRRLGRVFRDDDELGASSDLSAAIVDALERSENLVVICSPRTPESRWVDREIEQFHALGKGDRIVAFLGEGSPRESFPAALRELQREPLAADARARAGLSARRARENALLRVLARLIGCEYDDLRQREQQRRQRFWRAVALSASALVLVLVGLTVLAVKSRNEARYERDRALALGLAQAATAASERDAQLATLLARRAVALHDAPDTRTCLRQALAAPGVRWRLPTSGTYLGVAWSPGGDRAIVHELGGRVRVLDADGAVLADFVGARVSGPPLFAPDGSFALVAGDEGSLLRISPEGAIEARATPTAGEELDHVRIDEGGAAVWVRDGDLVRRLDAQLVETARIEVGERGVRSFLPIPDGEHVIVLAKNGHVLRLPFGEEAPFLAELPSWGASTMTWEVPGRSFLVADPGLYPAHRVDLTTQPPHVEELPSATVAVPLHARRGVVREGALEVHEQDGTLRASRAAGRARRVVLDAGGRVVVALADGDVVTLDAVSGAGATWSGARATKPLEVASTRGGTRLLLATGQEGLWCVDLSHGELGAHVAPTPMLWSDGGPSFLALAGSAVQRVDTAGRVLRIYRMPGRLVRAAVESTDGTSVAVGYADGTCCVWHGDGHQIADVDLAIGAITALRAHPAGGWIVAGEVGAARLLAADGSAGRRLGGHVGALTHLAVAGSGARVLTGTEGEQVRLWQGDGTPLTLLHLGGDRVRFADFLTGSDGVALVGASRARLFDAEGNVIAFLEAGQETFEGAVPTPDGRLLVYGTRVRVLGPAGDSRLLPSPSVAGARLAPGGGRALLWTPGPFADVLDMVHGGIRPLGGHAGRVTAAAFLPGGAGLATGTSLGAAHLWSDEGALRAVLELGEAPVRELLPDPTGRHLLVRDDLGMLRHVLLDDRDVDELAARRGRRELTWAERVAYQDLLGDPGPDPTPARIAEAVEALDRVLALSDEEMATPAGRAVEQELDDLGRALAPGSTEDDRRDIVLAAIGRVRPEDARRLEQGLRMKFHLRPTTARKLAKLRTLLEAWRKDHGRYPTDEQGLAVLDPGGSVQGVGAAEASPLLDAWGAVFRYRTEGEGYVLSSAGPDGLHGTDDDIR
ncbi:MAG: TIR domain-containing protein [Planctomycetota bacterium]